MEGELLVPQVRLQEAMLRGVTVVPASAARLIAASVEKRCRVWEEVFGMLAPAQAGWLFTGKEWKADRYFTPKEGKLWGPLVYVNTKSAHISFPVEDYCEVENDCDDR